MAMHVSVKDEDIYAPVIDYSNTYPNRESEIIAKVNYRDLRSGRVTILGKKVSAASISSYPMAREIAETLKTWILEGNLSRRI